MDTPSLLNWVDGFLKTLSSPLDKWHRSRALRASASDSPRGEIWDQFAVARDISLYSHRDIGINCWNVAVPASGLIASGVVLPNIAAIYATTVASSGVAFSNVSTPNSIQCVQYPWDSSDVESARSLGPFHFQYQSANQFQLADPLGCVGHPLVLTEWIYDLHNIRCSEFFNGFHRVLESDWLEGLDGFLQAEAKKFLVDLHRLYAQVGVICRRAAQSVMMVARQVEWFFHARLIEPRVLHTLVRV